MTEVKKPDNMIIPKGTKNYAYFKRVSIELQDAVGAGSFFETLGTPVFKDALVKFYDAAYRHELKSKLCVVLKLEKFQNQNL